MPPSSVAGPDGEEAYNALVVDPTRSGTIYLATQGNGVLRYTAP